jgi:hypothetical protein
MVKGKATERNRLAEELGIEIKESSKTEIQDLEEKETESVNKIKELDEKIKKAEKHIAVVPDTETPTKEEVDRHVASGHANFKRWCSDCQKGMAMRRPHRRKESCKRDADGNVEVPDTEEASHGWTKSSMDYMVMDDESESKANATMVLVNHEDGGVFAYATPNKGILGESQWLPKRMSKDIDNCGSNNFKLQIKSDTPY